MATTFVPPSPAQWEGPARGRSFTPPPVDSWQGEAKPAFVQPQGSATGRAAKGFFDTTLGGLGQTAKILVDAARAHATGTPVSQETAEALSGIVQAHADQAQKMKDAWGQGRYSEAFGHALATALPVVGPAAAHAAERIGGEAPVLDKYGNVVTSGRAPDVAGGLGEGAGLIVSSSPKNIVAPALRGAGSVLPNVPARMTPEGMYQSALRPGLSKKNLPKIQGQVATGLREGIPVSGEGLNRLQGTIDDVNSEISSRIATESARQGPVIQPADVANRVQPLRTSFGQQVNPNADLAAIDKSSAEFVGKHTPQSAPGQPPNPPQPLTLAEAQAEKQGTYRQLRKKYGELGSADVEAQKALARGLKEEIVARVPELADLNARDGALIDLEGQLARMVAREGNKNLLGLVPATMSHNPTGFLATLMLDNPAIKSRVAIALDRARTLSRQTPNPASLSPAAIPGAVAGQQEPPRLGPPR